MFPAIETKILLKSQSEQGEFGSLILDLSQCGVITRLALSDINKRHIPMWH